MKKSTASASAEYYVGGRSIGSGVFAMTYVMTGISASGTIGMVGLGYTIGWAASWLYIAFGIGFALAFIVLGPRIWEIAKRTGALTIVDLIHRRFDSRGLSALSAVMMVVFFVPYLMVQYVGSGVMFEAFLGIDYNVAVWVFGLVITAYVCIGGYRAVAYTDTMQAVVLLTAFVSLTVYGLVNFDVSTMRQTFEAELPGAVGDPWGSVGLVAIIGLGLPYILGVAGMPMLTMRFMTAKSKRVIGIGGVVAMTVPVFGAWFVTIAPSMAHEILPAVENPDQVLVLLMLQTFPPVVAAFFVTALLAAMMSTADSILMISGSTIARDLYQRFFRPDLTDRQLVTISRLVMFVVGVAALVLALLPQLPLLLVIVAWVFGVFACTFTFLFLGVTWWRRMNASAGYVAIIAGTGSYAGWSIAGEPGGIPPLVFALLVVIPLVVACTYLLPARPGTVAADRPDPDGPAPQRAVSTTPAGDRLEKVNRDVPTAYESEQDSGA